MAIKLNPAKAQFVIDLLKSNSNRFTTAQLLSATGNERRARSALSHARMAGIVLEAVRDSGRAVTAYVANGALPSLPASAAKASRAKSAKSAKTARVAAPKAKAAPAAPKTPKIAAPVKDVDAIKAKNLETMKAVSAKNNKLEQKLAEVETVRDDAESEEIAREEREAARASVREYLKKEVYAE